MTDFNRTIRHSGAAVTAHWFSAHQSVKLSRHASNPLVHRFLRSLWPASIEYLAAFKPVFLSEFISLKSLATDNTWLIRDGIVPLLWFFRSHPTPHFGRKKKSPRLLVHESLGAFVPPAWRKLTGTYRIASNPIYLRDLRRKRPERRFLLCGLVSPHYISIVELERQLREVEERVGTVTFRKASKLAFFQSRFDTQNDPTYPIEFFLKLCAHVGKNLAPLSLGALDALDNLTGYEVIDLNQKLLCANSYLTHLALSRGASIAGISARRDEQYRAISPYHGIYFTNKIREASVFGDRMATLDRASIHYGRFQEAMRSETNRKFPWPEWLMEWSQAGN